MAWPDGGLNPVIDVIRTDTEAIPPPDFTSIAAWLAATAHDCTVGWGSGKYASPCSPVGVCYDDDDLGGFDFTGATTSADYYRTLTAAVGQRHNGTAYGGGVNCVVNTDYARVVRDLYAVVEWIICSGWPSTGIVFYYQPNNACGILRNCVMSGGRVEVDNGGTGLDNRVQNCVFHGQATSQYAAVINHFTKVLNCSILAGGNAWAVQNVVTCTNVIVVGGAVCFYNCGGDYNISSDATAPGAHSIPNIAAADLFVNVGAGTEDLHLKSDATAASDAGSDLSATFTIDIDGQTRVDWDIGADEYIAAGGSSRRRRLICGAST